MFIEYSCWKSWIYFYLHTCKLYHRWWMTCAKNSPLNIKMNGKAMSKLKNSTCFHEKMLPEATQIDHIGNSHIVPCAVPFFLLFRTAFSFTRSISSNHMLIIFFEHWWKCMRWWWWVCCNRIWNNCSLKSLSTMLPQIRNTASSSYSPIPGVWPMSPSFGKEAL